MYSVSSTHFGKNYFERILFPTTRKYQIHFIGIDPACTWSADDAAEGPKKYKTFCLKYNGYRTDYCGHENECICPYIIRKRQTLQ